jgi:ketosteroid isomerase-like protein
VTATPREVLGLFAIAVMAACSIHRTEGEITVTAVEARLVQAYRDMAAGDIDQLMALYTEDALIQSAGERPLSGTTAIRAFWQTTFDRYDVQLIPEIHEVTSVAEMVVVRGRAVGVLAPKSEAAAMLVDSWFMQIYSKQADGSLRFWRGANGPNPATLDGEATR